MSKRMSLSWRNCLRLMLVCLLGIVAAAALPAGEAPANNQFFPLKDLRPGMKAVGRTVFSGSAIEEFQVEILGVLNNVGPKQSIILGRLSGGPLDKTGVMAGMSGSPVYIGGKLVGAVALSFPFSKEPIAGITPIEQMASVLERPEGSEGPPVIRVNLHSVPTPEGTEPRLAAAALGLTASGESGALAKLPAEEGVLFAPGQPGPRLMRIATPLVLSGFTSRALEQFAPQFRALGLEPMQGGGGGASQENSEMGDASALQPGSMISVQLIRGDFGVNADGTVTYRDGNRIYAFGHRFLSAGPIEMPFAESSVVTLLPNSANSFKISTPGRMLGAIRQDRSSGVLGSVGEPARMIPVTVTMRPGRGRQTDYRFEIVRDPFLSPLLLQLTLFGTIDATERALGESMLGVRGTIALKALPPVRLENAFSSEANTAIQAAQITSVPLALLLQSGFPGIDVTGIQLEITSADQRRVTSLDQVWSSKREAHPGDKLEITAVLRAETGTETVKKVPIEVPPSLGPGPLQITVADGNSLNLSEVRELPGGFTPKSAEQLVRAINNLRKNNRLYVRLSRPQTAFLLRGVQFPAPPPSLARAMANEASVSTDIATTQISTLSETELEALPSMVTGQKTITVIVRNN